MASVRPHIRIYQIAAIAVAALICAALVIGLHLSITSFALLIPTAGLASVYFRQRNIRHRLEAQQLSAALRESEQRFRAAFNQAAEWPGDLEGKMARKQIVVPHAWLF
jgi:hypothetical protein